MELQDICTSYKMSLKLKEAGFDAETAFWWGKHKVSREPELLFGNATFGGIKWEYTDLKAYTFEQIATTMPQGLALWVEDPYIEVVEQTYYGYEAYVNFGVTTSFANAAASAWLWCKEKGYIK